MFRAKIFSLYQLMELKYQGEIWSYIVQIGEAATQQKTVKYKQERIPFV